METINEVEGDGFKINSKIDINLVSDTPIGIKITSIGLSGFAGEFELLNPDMILVLEIGLKFCQHYYSMFTKPIIRTWRKAHETMMMR